MADFFQVLRYKPVILLLHPSLLVLKPLDLFLAPLVLPALQVMPLHLASIFFRLNVDLLNLELDSSELDDIVFLQRVLLFDVPVGDVTHNEVYLLKCIARVLKLLTRLSILLVNVLGHEDLLLSLCQFLNMFDVRRFDHVVISYLSDVKE